MYNLHSVTSNAVATQTVRYIGNAQGKTLAEIFNTYSKQNTMIYKGYFDWNDSRCPLYGQGADTVEITCYDWYMVATNIKGVSYTYDDTNNVWVIASNIQKYVEISCSIKGSVKLSKIGKLVIAQYYEGDNTTFNPTPEGQWTAIATIPQDFRPKYNVYFADEGGNSNIGRYQIYANTTTIQFYRFSGQTYYWETAFNVMWITN